MGVMKELEKYLKLFKESEQDFQLYLLNDPAVCQGIVAWESTPLVLEPSEQWPQPPDLNKPTSGVFREHLWLWLWDRVSIDDRAFEILAKVEDGRETIDKLMRLRLIYPDGTVHKKAKAIIMTKVHKMLEPAIELSEKLKKEKEKEDNNG